MSDFSGRDISHIGYFTFTFFHLRLFGLWIFFDFELELDFFLYIFYFIFIFISLFFYWKSTYRQGVCYSLHKACFWGYWKYFQFSWPSKKLIFRDVRKLWYENMCICESKTFLLGQPHREHMITSQTEVEEIWAEVGRILGRKLRGNRGRRRRHSLWKKTSGLTIILEQ